MKDSKKDDKKKKKAKNPGDSEGDGADGNTIQFHPRLEKCTEFLQQAVTMIIQSTNKIFNLEDDLMPFLNKDKEKKNPNFPITEEFEWIVKARQDLGAMIEENIKGPLNLIDEYKKFEYILNVDKKALVKELFGD